MYLSIEVNYKISVLVCSTVQVLVYYWFSKMPMIQSVLFETIIALPEKDIVSARFKYYQVPQILIVVHHALVNY